MGRAGYTRRTALVTARTVLVTARTASAGAALVRLAHIRVITRISQQGRGCLHPGPLAVRPGSRPSSGHTRARGPVRKPCGCPLRGGRHRVRPLYAPRTRAAVRHSATAMCCCATFSYSYVLLCDILLQLHAAVRHSATATCCCAIFPPATAQPCRYGGTAQMGGGNQAEGPAAQAVRGFDSAQGR